MSRVPGTKALVVDHRDEKIMPFSEMRQDAVREQVAEALKIDPMVWVFISGVLCKHGCFHPTSCQTGDIRFSRDQFEDTCFKYLADHGQHPDDLVLEDRAKLVYDAWIVERDEKVSS